MRIYEIALFMLIVGLMLSFSQTYLFGNERFGATVTPVENEIYDRLNQSQAAAVEYDPFGLQQATAYIGTAIHGLNQVAEILYGATVGLQGTLAEMLGGSGAAHTVATLIAFPIWMVYLLALMQFLRGVGTKGMD